MAIGDAFSYTGANMRHGPHQDAQKSTKTMSFSLTVLSKFSAPSSMVAIGPSLFESRDSTISPSIPNS